MIVIGGSTRIPKLQNVLKGRFPESELLSSISPDEVVAIGAAVQVWQTKHKAMTIFTFFMISFLMILFRKSQSKKKKFSQQDRFILPVPKVDLHSCVSLVIKQLVCFFRICEKKNIWCNFG